MRVRSFTHSELTKDVLSYEDSFRFEVAVNAIDIPFSELQMVIQCSVNGQSLDRIVLVPIVPLRFCRFFTEDEAERDDYTYTTGAEQEVNVSNPVFSGNAEIAARSIFPNCYLNVNNQYCGVMAFCTNDLLIRYEVLPEKDKLKARLFGLSLTNQNGVQTLNSAILLLLQNIQFLLK